MSARLIRTMRERFCISQAGTVKTLEGMSQGFVNIDLFKRKQNADLGGPKMDEISHGGHSLSLYHFVDIVVGFVNLRN